MPRGALVTLAGLGMWAAARLTGSAGLHLVAVGITVLPLLSWLIGSRHRNAITGERAVASAVVQVGQGIRVSVSVKNTGSRPTSFLLLEDRAPAELGPPARFVFDRIPRGNSQTTTYERAARKRGRYVLGPLVVHSSDPFVLTTQREEMAERNEVLICPVVEELGELPPALFGSGRGESHSRQVFRTGDELYAMRRYQTGDDLRRIHWPSVARTGELMIRQDEVARRASAILMIDTRDSLLGKTYTPAFEKAISAAASVGRLLLERGFLLRLCTPGEGPVPVDESHLMERMATIADSASQGIRDEQLRGAVDAGTTLVVVSGVPREQEVAQLTRTGSGFGRRIAVLVHALDHSEASADAWQTMEDRASAAMTSLTRAGWEVTVVQPSASLREIWRRDRKSLARSAS